MVFYGLAELEKALGYEAKTLYALSNNVKKHYHPAQIPKKNGEMRNLLVPDMALKSVQKAITDKILQNFPVSPYAYAYRKGFGIKKNARQHTGKEKVLNLDIEKFFDHILYTQVKDYAFPKAFFAEDVRILLSILCYGEKGLPQGAPSSPVITNLVMFDFDMKVGKWCEKQGIDYSRYCDDMSFSGDFDEKAVISFVKRELRRLNMSLKREKTRVAKRGSRQTVTGIVVNEIPSVPSEYRRKLRQEIYYLKKFGAGHQLRRYGLKMTAKDYFLSLLGRVNYVLHISPDNYEMWQYRRYLKNMLRQSRLQPRRSVLL